MAYATFADVLARAGRFAGGFQVEGSHPDETDVEGVLQNVSDEIDAALRGHGFDPGGFSDSVKGALVDITAFGALSRLLPAVATGDEAATLIKTADTLHTDGVAAITAGTLPALAELHAGLGGEAVISAGNLWADEGVPDDGLASPDSPVDPFDPYYRRLKEDTLMHGTNVGPAFIKGQSL